MHQSLIRRSFFYFAQSVVHPRRCFSLLKQESTFSVGFFLNALKWVLCEFYVYYLYATDQVFFIRPWLNIPEDQYRFYQLFFYIPVGILLWIFNAGVVQTLSTALGGKGTFTDTLNICGIVVFTPFVFIDTIDMLFIILNGGDWNIVFNTITRTLLVLYGSFLLVMGLMEMHDLKLIKSILIALIMVPLGIFVTLIFVR